MSAIWMEWGGDLRRNPQGGLLLSYGQDQTRQGIIRELLTTPGLTLDDGSRVQPEFYLVPTFGGGLRALVGQAQTEGMIARITQRINQVVLRSPGVNSAIPPVVSTSSRNNGNTVFISARYTGTNGQPQAVAFQIG